ncbi:MAG: hypothetical protein A3F74_22950 [Betaproteobacteria bacterium RIFCSPLOWO2_12_FULL_62_58]|nr:MAG: hypothetical protein A3F74_22950 [Betaproteobacteria bacterium RIFCSPLOWO2_12_FULL_62_58]
MKSNGKPKDKDLLGAHAALKRAARRALETARRTGTPCYVMRHGKLVDIAHAGRIPRRTVSR